MNAQVTVETINPKTAQEWLDNKLDEQRTIRENQVLKLASEIKNGKFRLTSDALVLIKGSLANGQHRLSAVVAAGRSAPFIVMRTNDDELYKVIDSGSPRTIADVIGRIPYAKAISSSARLILVYDRQLMSAAGENMSGNKSILTRSEILDFIEKNHEKLSEQSAFVYGLYGQTRIVGCTVATAFLHIASRKHPDLAKDFITNVYMGEKVDASKTFRDRMIKQMGTKSRLRQSYIFALLIKSWRSYRNGTLPGALKMVDGELFPQI